MVAPFSILGHTPLASELHLERDSGHSPGLDRLHLPKRGANRVIRRPHRVRVEHVEDVELAGEDLPSHADVFLRLMSSCVNRGWYSEPGAFRMIVSLLVRLPGNRPAAGVQEMIRCAPG